MAENNTQTTEVAQPEVETKSNPIKNFVATHPRIARVAGITAGVATVIGVFVVAKNAKDDVLELGSDADVLELSPSTETTMVAEA